VVVVVAEQLLAYIEEMLQLPLRTPHERASFYLYYLACIEHSYLSQQRQEESRIELANCVNNSACQLNSSYSTLRDYQTLPSLDYMYKGSRAYAAAGFR
jgi:NADH:ubiquinone oxidoreductase subunit E